jgi:hypothetical protein
MEKEEKKNKEKAEKQTKLEKEKAERRAEEIKSLRNRIVTRK